MSQRARVLVVDDERNIRLTLRAALENLDVEVEEAADGGRALDLCDRSHFDAVVLDLRLPDVGGLEVLSRLRARLPGLRVVIVTAHGTVDAAVEAMKLGAYDFLQKPFDPPQIRDVVARMLRGEPAGGAGPSAAEILHDARRAAREGRTEAALQLAQRAVAAMPESAAAFHVLGVAHDVRGDRLRAQVLYRTALALDPTHVSSERNLDRSIAGAGGDLLYGDEPRKKR